MPREPIRLAMAAAVGRNGVIGREGALPWRLPSDLARFKAATLGKPVLMGRKTWDSIGRALPGRPNLVLTRDANLRAPGAWVFSDLALAVAAGRALARAAGAEECVVIGGGALYQALLDQADRLYLSMVEASPEGDARFPAFDPAAFRETACEAVAPGPRDDHAFTWRVLDRVTLPRP
jgi:dihydrofolate reductase